jgi:predicted metal-binding membrane protein
MNIHFNHTEPVGAPAEALFDVMTDYASYPSFNSALIKVEVGAHHGGYCLGCCWGLMVILIAVGVMNVAAMVGLAVLVLIEKVWR